jgi:hypothetical protein
MNRPTRPPGVPLSASIAPAVERQHSDGPSRRGGIEDATATRSRGTHVPQDDDQRSARRARGHDRPAPAWSSPPGPRRPRRSRRATTARSRSPASTPTPTATTRIWAAPSRCSGSASTRARSRPGSASLQASTACGRTLHVDGPGSVFVGEDEAGGANDQVAEATYTLGFTGARSRTRATTSASTSTPTAAVTRARSSGSVTGAARRFQYAEPGLLPDRLRGPAAGAR